MIHLLMKSFRPVAQKLVQHGLHSFHAWLTWLASRWPLRELHRSRSIFASLQVFWFTLFVLQGPKTL